MTKIEALHENYENVLFALLMYNVAQVDGRAFLELNEKHKNVSSVSITQEMDQRCLNAIKTAFVHKKGKSFFNPV